MITKRNTFICDSCGLFCRPYDEYTPFGCSSYDPPEPLDPSHTCKKCFKTEKKKWLEDFKRGNRNGDWQKSNAEMEAAEECGLKWIHSSGIGMLSKKGTKDFAEPYRYISKEEHNRLSALPYWGYCKTCEAERKGGYCSDSKCEESFENHTNKK